MLGVMAEVVGANFGSLDITPTPSGARILLDGQNTQAVTPTVIEDVLAGTQTITPSRQG